MATPESLYPAVLAGRLKIYNAYLAAAKGTPFIYPWDSLPALYLFFGIVIRPYVPASIARPTGYATFAAVISHSSYILWNRRCLGFAGGYGVGLATMWGIIVTGVWLLLHEPEKDYVRLEVREAATAATYIQSAEGVSYFTGGFEGVVQDLKDKQQNGDAVQVFEPKKRKSTPKANKNRAAPKYGLIWQPFPTEPLHCIDWTIDFMTSFRGPNFNFRVPTLPKLKTVPPPAQYKITKSIEPSMMANEATNSLDSSNVMTFKDVILSTMKWYILVDLIKIIMLTDPYFLGIRPMSSPSPWPFLRNALGQSSSLSPSMMFFTKLARLLVSLAGVQIWLSLIFSLSPLFFYTILHCLIPQSILIKITKAPLYDPRMYAPLFNNVLTNVVDTGLAGFWGRYWHQMFRYGISEPSRPLIRLLNIDPKSQLGRSVQLFVAFGLTGTIHAAASLTTFSVVPTRPQDAFVFFFSQAIGITLQTALSELLMMVLKIKKSSKSRNSRRGGQKSTETNKRAKLLRRVCNLGFVLVWLWFTGPLLANDFARGGIWLFEPVPVSFLRGIMGKRWFVWGGEGMWAGWWNGSGWWNSGLAIY